MTPTQALKLYETACSTHKRSDWRVACHALAAVVNAGKAAPAPEREKPKPKPTSLCEYLAKAGGLADAGGELRARDAELWHKGRPFCPRLVRPDGMSFEAAAERAYDAGYFPVTANWDSSDNAHPVTEDMLLHAIDRELAGRPVYVGAMPHCDDDYWYGLESDESLQWAAE